MKLRSLLFALVSLTALLGCPLGQALIPLGGSGYSTVFPLTENPISEGGVWTNGGTTGLDWTNVQTTAGLAFATQVAGPSPPFTDSVASLGGFGPNQWAQGVVHNASANLREVELLLRWTITAHNTTGYEIDVTTNFGLGIARWNGALNSFTFLAQNITTNVSTAEGAVWYAQIVGSTITVNCNGTQVFSGTDSTFATGNPGIGFFSSTNNGTPTANNTFGWKSFRAGQL